MRRDEATRGVSGRVPRTSITFPERGSAADKGQDAVHLPAVGTTLQCIVMPSGIIMFSASANASATSSRRSAMGKPWTQ